MVSSINTNIHILYLYNINVPLKIPVFHYPFSNCIPHQLVSQSSAWFAIFRVQGLLHFMSKSPTKKIPTDGCPFGLHCLHLRQQLPPEPVLLHLRRRLKTRRRGPAGSRPRGIGSTPPWGGGSRASEKNRGPKKSAQNRGKKNPAFDRKGPGGPPRGGGGRTHPPLHLHHRP